MQSQFMAVLTWLELILSVLLLVLASANGMIRAFRYSVFHLDKTHSQTGQLTFS